MNKEDEFIIKNQIIAFIKPIIFISIGILLAMFLFKYCNKKTDYVSPKIDLNLSKVKVLKNKVDSLNSVKKHIVVKYKTLRDTILKEYIKDSLIINYVNTVDSILVIDSALITSQASIIQFQDTIISNQHQQIFTLTKQNKREKRRKVFTSIGTFILGIVVGRVAN